VENYGGNGEKRWFIRDHVLNCTAVYLQPKDPMPPFYPARKTPAALLHLANAKNWPKPNKRTKRVPCYPSPTQEVHVSMQPTSAYAPNNTPSKMQPPSALPTDQDQALNQGFLYAPSIPLFSFSPINFKPSPPPRGPSTPATPSTPPLWAPATPAQSARPGPTRS
jgi:hypothetical protein